MKAFTQNSVHRMFVAGILFISITCSSPPPPVVNAPPQIESTTESIDELLRQANLATGPDSASLRLKAIEELVKLSKMQILEGKRDIYSKASFYAIIVF